MILQLNIHNQLSTPIVINSQSASGQPIQPNQSLQATFSVHEDPRTNTATLHLYIDDGPRSPAR